MSENPFSIEMTTVGMMLWNPTNEDFDMQYAGISITLKAGEKQIFAIKCATHLLNAFGQRGLTSLVYGADEEKVGKAAIARNIEFKKAQVTRYNQTNEQRRLTGHLGFLPATAKLKEWALELGNPLTEPYNLKDEEKTAISKSTSENEELKKKLASQETEMTEMKEMMKQLLENQEAAKKPGPMVRKDGKWVKE